jgi:hypothetical protein
MWGGILTPHGPCSYCYSPYDHVRDCSTGVNFSNYSYKHMNTPFSRPRNDSYFDSYNPAWSNQFNISWQAQAPTNYAPQFHELHHQSYPQFNGHSYDFHQYQSTPQQHYQVKPLPLMSSNFQEKMLASQENFLEKMSKLISKMSQAVEEMVNSHSEFVIPR